MLNSTEDDDHEARRQLLANGGGMLIDVAKLPIDEVRELNARREIDDLFRAMSPAQREQLIAAGRSIVGECE